MRTTLAAGLAASALAVWGAGSLRAEGDVQPSQEFKNIVIQGVPRLHMRGDKADKTPKLDPKQPISDYLTQNTELMSPGDKLLLNLPPMLPPRVASDLVASPWHRLLWTPPVMSLTIANPTKVQLAHWRLTVTDDAGVVFQTIQKTQLPERIEWDGIGANNEPLKVGHSYSCALSVLDKSDVPSYITNKTVRLSSYVDSRGHELRILLDTPTIFSRGSSLSADGKARLLEARDWLRDYYGSTIKVDVYGSDAELARLQAEAARDVLAETLQLNKDDIKARGHDSEAERYFRTEITAR